MAVDDRPVLVIGATGYIGGRLVPRLLEAGYEVRVLARSVAKIKCRPWGIHPNLHVVKGDAMDLPSMINAAQGCRAAYYLVHSMISASRDFADADRISAQNMVLAAGRGGLEQIIYLGGLGREDDSRLSKHLQSRHQVGKILHDGPTPATVLRAAMILGSGSASFEMLRYLVDRLPVMITPRWVKTPVQPISVRNVLEYLEGCLECPDVRGKTFDIGGPDVLTYRDLIQIYAQEAHLPKRRIIPVPVLTPRLSSLWIHLVTPVPASIARPLAEGLDIEVICGDNSIRNFIPVPLQSCRDAIRMALDKVRQQAVETCWTDAGDLLPPEWTYCGDAEYSGGTILDCGYKIVLEADPQEVWQHIVRIGGRKGWYFGNPLWEIRGWLDRLVGGAGLRRGRRHPTQLYVGDALDFWRVLQIDPPHRLLLLAEMKTPGEAVLEFRITPRGESRTELIQLSRFLPRGLGGLAYWYLLYPFHEWIFQGMLINIAHTAGREILEGPVRFTAKLKNTCRI